MSARQPAFVTGAAAAAGGALCHPAWAAAPRGHAPHAAHAIDTAFPKPDPSSTPSSHLVCTLHLACGFVSPTFSTHPSPFCLLLRARATLPRVLLCTQCTQCFNPKFMPNCACSLAGGAPQTPTQHDVTRPAGTLQSQAQKGGRQMYESRQCLSSGSSEGVVQVAVGVGAFTMLCNDGMKGRAA